MSSIHDQFLLVFRLIVFSFTKTDVYGSGRQKRLKYRKNTTRSVSVKLWLSRRTNLCVYDSLLQELRSEDEAEYRKFLRMAPENLDELLEIPSTLL